MNWETLANIGQFVSAIAVLISLAYLAVQIRQNTQTVRANAYHGAATEWLSFTAQLSADAELAELYHAGRFAPSTLTPPQSRRFDLVLDTNLGLTENVFLQYRLGFLPQANQDRFAAILRAQFQTEGVRAYWQRRRAFYTADFVAYIERELKLVAPPAP
ncbi:MAG: hypothetical protein FJ091_20240 [Deltaproteobacteria bacterium]|nr:hypothetical protein [Deltaproteobacteria bacterium]